MKYLNIIKKIVVSLIALVLLINAFLNNNFLGRLIIIPFFVGIVSMIGESMFLLLNKKKMADIFKNIFKLNLFIYSFGITLWIIYYSIVNNSYSLLFLVGIFWLFIISFIKINFKK